MLVPIAETSCIERPLHALREVGPSGKRVISCNQVTDERGQEKEKPRIEKANNARSSRRAPTVATRATRATRAKRAENV